MNNRYNSFVLKTLSKFLKNGDMRCLMLSVMNENEYNEYQVHFLVLKEKKKMRNICYMHFINDIYHHNSRFELLILYAKSEPDYDVNNLYA